jgi:hypothetical protein
MFKARFVVGAGTQGGKTCFEPDWLRREIIRCGPGDYLVITATFPLELKLLPEFRYVFETAFHYGTYSDSRKILVFSLDGLYFKLPYQISTQPENRYEFLNRHISR